MAYCERGPPILLLMTKEENFNVEYGLQNEVITFIIFKLYLPEYWQKRKSWKWCYHVTNTRTKRNMTIIKSNDKGKQLNFYQKCFYV